MLDGISVVPSRNMIAVAALVLLTIILVAWPYKPQRSVMRDEGTARSIPALQTSDREVRAEFFVPKSVIVVPAPPQPSAFAVEQKMSYGELMRRWSPAIADASKRFSVPSAWIRAVMQLESGGRTMLGENQPIVSRAGAQGLMQLMPSTYNDMRRQYRLGADPFNPRDNIMAGAAYLRFLRAKYAFPAMFEAYNDGPGHLEERLKAGNLLPAETQLYVANITRKLGGASAVASGAMIKLTRPDGLPVWVNAANTVKVRAPLPGEYTDDVHAVIAFGKGAQGVRESVAIATRLLREHGAAV
jgi:membrane-bound lytic murein transglycosylase B